METLTKAVNGIFLLVVYCSIWMITGIITVLTNPKALVFVTLGFQTGFVLLAVVAVGIHMLTGKNIVSSDWFINLITRRKTAKSMRLHEAENSKFKFGSSNHE